MISPFAAGSVAGSFRVQTPGREGLGRSTAPVVFAGGGRQSSQGLSIPVVAGLLLLIAGGYFHYQASQGQQSGSGEGGEDNPVTRRENPPRKPVGYVVTPPPVDLSARECRIMPPVNNGAGAGSDVTKGGGSGQPSSPVVTDAQILASMNFQPVQTPKALAFTMETGIQVMAPPGNEAYGDAAVDGLRAISPRLLRLAGQQGLKIKLVPDSRFPAGGRYDAPNTVYVVTYDNADWVRNTVVHETNHFLEDLLFRFRILKVPIHDDPGFAGAFRADVVALLGDPGQAAGGNLEQAYRALTMQFRQQFPQPGDLKLTTQPNCHIGQMRRQGGESAEEFQSRAQVLWHLINNFTKARQGVGTSPREAFAEMARRLQQGQEPFVVDMFPRSNAYVQGLFQQLEQRAR